MALPLGNKFGAWAKSTPHPLQDVATHFSTSIATVKRKWRHLMEQQQLAAQAAQAAAAAMQGEAQVGGRKQGGAPRAAPSSQPERAAQGRTSPPAEHTQKSAPAPAPSPGCRRAWRAVQRGSSKRARTRA